MRTTLSIDDDLLAAARSLARAKSQSLGQALSELAR
ncbi:MAG: type II toxin-antitoxin system VapB family antitoxin, partial [Kiritimatiellia bacterium]